MNSILTIIVIFAIVLAIFGGLVPAVNFLLWVGIALLVIAVIAWALRAIGGRNRA